MKTTDVQDVVRALRLDDAVLRGNVLIYAASPCSESLYCVPVETALGAYRELAAQGKPVTRNAWVGRARPEPFDDEPAAQHSVRSTPSTTLSPAARECWARASAMMRTEHVVMPATRYYSADPEPSDEPEGEPLPPELQRHYDQLRRDRSFEDTPNEKRREDDQRDREHWERQGEAARRTFGSFELFRSHREVQRMRARDRGLAAC